MMRYNAAYSLAADAAQRCPDVEEVTENGRTFLKVPVVPLREMVLDYPENDRREYVSADALSESVERWNGVPITTEHPAPTPGMSPTVTPPIGMLTEAELTDDETALRGTALIDVHQAKRTSDGQSVVNRLRDGGEVSVSAGYDLGSVDFEAGAFEGEQYDLTQQEFQPHHLALFSPDGDAIARCSPTDGCAAPRANAISCSCDEPGACHCDDRGTAPADPGVSMHQQVAERRDEIEARYEAVTGRSLESELTPSELLIVEHGLDRRDESDDRPTTDSITMQSRSNAEFEAERLASLTELSVDEITALDDDKRKKLWLTVLQQDEQVQSGFDTLVEQVADAIRTNQIHESFDEFVDRADAEIRGDGYADDGLRGYFSNQRGNQRANYAATPSGTPGSTPDVDETDPGEYGGLRENWQDRNDTTRSNEQGGRDGSTRGRRRMQHLFGGGSPRNQFLDRSDGHADLEGGNEYGSLSEDWKRLNGYTDGGGQ